MNAAAIRLIVAELAALATRQAQALAEAGRPDLAEHCHVRVDRDGTVSLSFTPRVDLKQGSRSPEVLKAIEIDPRWKAWQ